MHVKVTLCLAALCFAVATADLTDSLNKLESLEHESVAESVQIGTLHEAKDDDGILKPIEVNDHQADIQTMVTKLTPNQQKVFEFMKKEVENERKKLETLDATRLNKNKLNDAAQKEYDAQVERLRQAQEALTKYITEYTEKDKSCKAHLALSANERKTVQTLIDTVKKLEGVDHTNAHKMQQVAATASLLADLQDNKDGDTAATLRDIAEGRKHKETGGILGLLYKLLEKLGDMSCEDEVMEIKKKIEPAKKEDEDCKEHKKDAAGKLAVARRDLAVANSQADNQKDVVKKMEETFENMETAVTDSAELVNQKNKLKADLDKCQEALGGKGGNAQGTEQCERKLAHALQGAVQSGAVAWFADYYNSYSHIHPGIKALWENTWKYVTGGKNDLVIASLVASRDPWCLTSTNANNKIARDWIKARTSSQKALSQLTKDTLKGVNILHLVMDSQGGKQKVPTLSDAEGKAVRQFVEDGGAVIVFLGHYAQRYSPNCGKWSADNFGVIYDEKTRCTSPGYGVPKGEYPHGLTKATAKWDSNCHESFNVAAGSQAKVMMTATGSVHCGYSNAAGQNCNKGATNEFVLLERGALGRVIVKEVVRTVTETKTVTKVVHKDSCPKPAVFDRYKIEGQVLAQAACVALNGRGGWAFAVRRHCGGTKTCSQVCGERTEGQAGRLSCFNSIHIYNNQPAPSDANGRLIHGMVGLKVHKYNRCNIASCGPNYCCCRNGPAATKAETEMLDAGVDPKIANGVDDEETPDVFAEFEKDSEEDDAAAAQIANLDVGEAKRWNAKSIIGQVTAQAMCVAMAKAGGWVFAVQRSCSSSYKTCAQMCASLREGQAGTLRAFNSLHLYGNSEYTTSQVDTLGLKTYRYNGAGGGCGPNYCCCGNSGSQDETTDLEAGAESGDVHADQEDEATLAEMAILSKKNPLEGSFEQYGIDGNVLAEAACTAMAPAQARQSGWIYAVRRNCAKHSQTCEQLCKGTTESQEVSEGKNPVSSGMFCINALHIYSNQPADPNAPAGKLGLKTYKYNSCRNTSCGPNYCCCWAGYAPNRP